MTPTIPDPYDRTVFHGKPLDHATAQACTVAEGRLGYELTILQGIGGAPASAGTHLAGRAVDLAPADHVRKVRVMRDLGFAAWYREAIPGLWGEHVHCVLIFEDRQNQKGIAPAAYDQIAAYDAGLDGLADHHQDPNPYRPKPRAVFTLAEYRATFAPPPPRARLLHDAHQSGRFDATPTERQAMLANLASASTVGALTEAKGTTPFTGWDIAGGESAVTWETDYWTEKASGTASIATPPWKRGKSKRTSVEIEWAVLTHRSTVLLRLAGHLPAHLFSQAQRRANKAAIDGLADVVKPLQAMHSPTVTTLSLDANRPLNLKRNQALFTEALAGTGLHLVVPPDPTRGRRTIDGFWTSGRRPTAAMLPRAKGFDHRGAVLAARDLPMEGT